MSERDIRRLLALIERSIGASWIDISDWLKSTDQNSLDKIEARLLAGDYQGIVAEVETAAKMFATETHGAYVTAGRRAAKWLDNQPALADRLVRFDVTNDRAINQAKRNELELVRGLTQETRETVHNIIADGTRTSVNPREMARDIRSSIGLTPTQEKAVRSYRQALRDGDWSNALGRELSSGQGDRTIRRLQRAGGGLSEKQIDDLTERYRQNALKWRAETIARTESAKNVHAGLDESFRQAVERGDVKVDQLVKEWIHASRGRSRPDHVAMSGKTVRFNEDFVLPDGTRMKYPHAPGAPVEHVANCRCTYATTLDAIDAVDALGANDGSTPAQPDDVGDKKPIAPPKNPKRVAAARIAGEVSAERRREIHSTARGHLPAELQTVWDKEGQKFMREEAARIRGVKDRVNAASTLSQAFAEKYGAGDETMFGNEGDRYHRRAQIVAEHGESWADEQERKYYARLHEEAQHGEADWPIEKPDDDDPPF